MINSRIMRAALLLLALSGCASAPSALHLCILTRPCQFDPIPTLNQSTTGQAATATAPHRVGAEIGGYPTASTLLGPERMIADQNGATVNITPSQISTFIFANGGTAGLNQLLPSQTGQNGNCLSTNGTNPLWAACGSGGGSTWPSLAGIPCYSGASSWCTSYNPINQIPASYIPTLNQNTTGLAGGLSGSPTMSGEFWGYNGSTQGWFTPSGSGISGANNTLACNNSGSSGSLIACTAASTIGVLTSGTPNAQTGTSYPLASGDCNGEVTMSNTASNALTINTSTCSAGNVVTVQQLNTGLTSITPGSGVTFCGAQISGCSTSISWPLGGTKGLIQFQQTATLGTWNVIAYQPGPGTFAVTGTCTTPTSQTGIATAGTMAMASAGNCTIIITPNGVLPAAHGWTGNMGDTTQPSIPTWRPTSSTTTAVTFTVPTAVASSDGISFGPLQAY